MLRAGGLEVDSGGVDRAVAQDVGQSDDIPAGPVEHRGEQVPQIVGKDLGGSHARPLTQIFHLLPDLPPAEASPAFGDKNLTGGGFLPLGVL